MTFMKSRIANSQAVLCTADAMSRDPDELEELEGAYEKVKRGKHEVPGASPGTPEKLHGHCTPLFFARRLTEKLLAREDLSQARRICCTPGAHKINNCLGQALLAERMARKESLPRPRAWCGHGHRLHSFRLRMHRVYRHRRHAPAGAQCVPAVDLLGAEVRGVDSGSRTLKDAMNEAMRDW